MKKIIFICPFFGNLPKEQMKYWLKSCSKNPNIDWAIITDDKTKFEYPDNVKIIYTSLEELKTKIQKKFDFKISLQSPYKLCDFKPTYGYIFKELVDGYDYWAHCDMTDSIFGNIEKILSPILDAGYDKIGFLGHLTIYKNTEEINKRIFLKSKAQKPLEEILGTDKNMAFDETFEYSINRIYEDNGFKIKRIDDLYSDISPRSEVFRESLWSDSLEETGLSKNRYIYEWDDGALYKLHAEKKKIIREEQLYVHYQKRKMKYEIYSTDQISHFYIVPNKFIFFKKVDMKILCKYTRKRINITIIKIRAKRLRNRLFRKREA